VLWVRVAYEEDVSGGGVAFSLWRTQHEAVKHARRIDTTHSQALGVSVHVVLRLARALVVGVGSSTDLIPVPADDYVIKGKGTKT
jgi:hypothetical protein